MTFQNNFTAKIEYRTTRILSLSMTSVQINEAVSRDWVLGMGYKINDLRLFGSHLPLNASRKTVKRTVKDRQSQPEKPLVGNGVNHELNLRCDLSYRRQASITRNIATITSVAGSGNTAYTLSRLLTMSFYYDHQTNIPLLSSTSYPTATHDFGLSVKFSLTR